MQRPFTRLRRRRPRTGFIAKLERIDPAPAAFYIGAVRLLAGPYGGTGRRVRLENRIPQGVLVRFRLGAPDRSVT